MPERFIRPDPLADRRFQQFLKDQQQLEETDPVNPDDWQRTQARNLKRDPYINRLWRILRRNPAFLVSGRKIAVSLRGSDSDRDMRLVASVGVDLREGIINPDSLYVRKIGQGFGIKSFTLDDPDELETVYFLWENMGKFVSSKVLAQKLYGVDQDLIGHVNDRYNALERRQSFSSAVVEQADFERHQRYYRLRVKGQPEPKKEIKHKNWSLEGVYSKEFQDWLVEAGIMGRADRVWGSFRGLYEEKRIFRMLRPMY